jgi:hypothetical protein
LKKVKRKAPPIMWRRGRELIGYEKEELDPFLATVMELIPILSPSYIILLTPWQKNAQSDQKHLRHIHLAFGIGAVII